jgi:hypothetical protein
MKPMGEEPGLEEFIWELAKEAAGKTIDFAEDATDRTFKGYINQQEDIVLQRMSLTHQLQQAM